MVRGQVLSGVVLLTAVPCSVPIPTYIMQGELPLPSKVISKLSDPSGQLCPNVFLMGKSSCQMRTDSCSCPLLGKANLLVTSQGLRIGLFGGEYSLEAFNDSLPEGVNPLAVSHFNADTLKAFLANPLLPQQSSGGTTLASAKNVLNQYIDVVMTHEWPAGIARNCTAPLPSPEANTWGVEPLQSLARLRPRYHFASGGGPNSVFWERQPYVWDEDGRITRFVSLGAFGGPEPEAGKKKERVRKLRPGASIWN